MNTREVIIDHSVTYKNTFIHGKAEPARRKTIDRITCMLVKEKNKGRVTNRTVTLILMWKDSKRLGVIF